MHPAWEQLVDYVDKRLTPEEAEQVTAHLAACETCDAEVEWLDRTTNNLRGVNFTAPPRALRIVAEELFAQRYVPPRALADGLPVASVTAPGAPPKATPRRRLPRIHPAVWQRTRWIGAAIALLLVVAFFVQQRPSAPTAPLIAAVQDVRGDVQVQRPSAAAQPLTLADSVREGDLLTTAANGTAQVAFAEGAIRVTMLGDSRLTYAQDRTGNADGPYVRLATDTSGDLEINVNGPPAVELAFPVMVLRMEAGTFRTHYLTERTVAVRVIEGTLTATTEDGASYTFTAGDDYIWQRDPQSGAIVPVPVTDVTPTPAAPSPTPQASATSVPTATQPRSVTAPATGGPTTVTIESTQVPTPLPAAAPPVAPSPSPPPALPSPAPTLPLAPTDDNSGSGGGDDDNGGSGSDDDNSGSGSGSDDNSGSGSGSDDNSGSGSGSDDNSGSESEGDDS